MRIQRILLIAACVLAVSAQADAAKYNFRWVLAHDPSVAAEQSARDFAERIEKDSAGDIHVDIVKSADYNKAQGRRVSHRTLLQHIVDGKVEMTQIYTAGLARFNPKLLTLGNPYLFRDYDHAESVIEGPLGREFLAAVAPSSGVRALGITYSGGYGIFATKDRTVRRPQDMRGLKLQSDRFAWLGTYSNVFGTDPISAPPEAFVPLAKLGFADAVETTVARFDEYGDSEGANTIIKTDHFLLTTMVIINEKAFNSLPKKYQEKIEQLAIETSRSERMLSIKANEDSRHRLEAKGIKFVDLTTDEKKVFAEALKGVYSEPWAVMGKDWAAAIRATQTTIRTAAR